MEVVTIRDCIRIRQDLDEFAKYCDLHMSELNVTKCVFISFFLNLKALHFDYHLGRFKWALET